MRWYGNQNLLGGNEPDAEPAIHEELAVVDESAAVTGEEDRAEPVELRAEPAAEGYLNWLIERYCAGDVTMPKHVNDVGCMRRGLQFRMV